MLPVPFKVSVPVPIFRTLAAVLATESRFPEARDAVASALKANPKNPAALDLNRKLTEALSR